VQLAYIILGLADLSPFQAGIFRQAGCGFEEGWFFQAQPAFFAGRLDNTAVNVSLIGLIEIDTTFAAVVATSVVFLRSPHRASSFSGNLRNRGDSDSGLKAYRKPIFHRLRRPQ
jgi:hypothetical protein